MNSPISVTKRNRILQYALFLGAALAVVGGVAHSSRKGPDRVIIDGKANPDRIPDWMVWDVVFRTAVQLNEKSPARGREVWMQRLHLPEKAMNEIVSHGYTHRGMVNLIDGEARQNLTSSESDHPNKNEDVKAKLKKNQLNLEKRTLEIRDKLRKRIGDENYMRIASFARLQIAPRIKIGG